MERKIKGYSILVLAVILGLTASCFFGIRRETAIERVNSGQKIENRADAVTSAEGEAIQKKPVTLLAFGDLLLGRYIKKAIDTNGTGYPFKNIRKIFEGNDLVLANLEGSFTDFKPGKLDPNNTVFTFDPDLAPVLEQTGFNVLNLANNHVRDFGKVGFEQSEAYLDKAGINHFGDYYNEGEPLIEDINGTKIAFVAYNEFGNASIDKTVAKVRGIRSRADYVVVYTHWGIEYQTNFSAEQQQKAHQLINAGADVILGSHPHVIQPIEIYNGKPIFYSLGNFLFDQIFSFDVRHGLGMKLSIGKGAVTIELYPTEMKNFQVGLVNDETKTAILKKIADKSLASETIKTQIAQGKLDINPK
jgi:poly-gamma-glutamate synthesis protein (capsule biosynthesis protein)